jgi:membrane-bound ClpP family serine protease
MLLSFALLILGLILILIEFYLPGMIMGVLGAISIVAGLIIFSLQSSSLIAVLLFAALSIALVILLIRFALWRIVRAKPERSIYSAANQEGFYASSFDQTAIGKQGVVLTDLKPGGFILVEGKKHSAISLAGYIPKGDTVLVISGQEQSLIVKPFKSKEHENIFIAS